MSAFTPGPWAIARTNSGTFIRKADGSPPGYLAEVRAVRSEKQCLADARLIASAPELLEVLEAMTVLAEGPTGGVTQQQKREVLAKARAAIAKARGEA